MNLVSHKLTEMDYINFILLFKDFWVLFFVNSPAHWKNTLFCEIIMDDCGRYSQRSFLNYNLKQYFTYLEPCSTERRLIRFAKFIFKSQPFEYHASHLCSAFTFTFSSVHLNHNIHLLGVLCNAFLLVLIKSMF